MRIRAHQQSRLRHEQHGREGRDLEVPSWRRNAHPLQTDPDEIISPGREMFSLVHQRPHGYEDLLASGVVITGGHLLRYADARRGKSSASRSARRATAWAAFDVQSRSTHRRGLSYGRVTRRALLQGCDEKLRKSRAMRSWLGEIF